MHSSAARRPEARTVSSIEAFVLAHDVEIASASEGVVARVFVRDREVVSAGQELVEITRGPGRSIVRSAFPGIVSRRHVRQGDAVAPSTPLLAMIRADDVLVVARFDGSAAALLARGKVASVRIPRATAQPIPARLLCVPGIQPAQAGAGGEATAVVRVVARLESAPPAAVWSGIEAIVDVECEP
jgi:pyruvate/2-oxoglutarate dehydrogenase complex dihydrolipoamide acyltransferase (E2) component